ncbi:hypothetical protein SDC9_76987 [bioreactor metagenome]|uniref:DUF7670 domain-containing protein n=1 Tax=bioreactor metagenome TaxID=1076179 RepID=A0A644YQ79_9ZZZZ
MFAPKRREPLWLQVSRWLVRLFCFGFIALFLFFFIGEGGIQELPQLKQPDLLRLAFIPGVFFLALLISFPRERFGGILMTLSFVGYHTVSWVSDKKIPTHWDFWWLLIPAILFIVFSVLSQNTRQKRTYQRRRR